MEFRIDKWKFMFAPSEVDTAIYEKSKDTLEIYRYRFLCTYLYYKHLVNLSFPIYI